MAARYTPEMLALLERQRAHFASAEHVRREVEAWRDATPVERLAALEEMCAAGEYFLSRMEPSVFERVGTREALPDDTLELLQSLRRLQPRFKP